MFAINQFKTKPAIPHCVYRQTKQIILKISENRAGISLTPPSQNKRSKSTVSRYIKKKTSIFYSLLQFSFFSYQQTGAGAASFSRLGMRVGGKQLDPVSEEARKKL